MTVADCEHKFVECDPFYFEFIDTDDTSMYVLRQIKTCKHCFLTKVRMKFRPRTNWTEYTDYNSR